MRNGRNCSLLQNVTKEINPIHGSYSSIYTAPLTQGLWWATLTAWPVMLIEMAMFRRSPNASEIPEASGADAGALIQGALAAMRQRHHVTSLFRWFSMRGVLTRLARTFREMLLCKAGDKIELRLGGISSDVNIVTIACGPKKVCEASSRYDAECFRESCPKWDASNAFSIASTTLCASVSAVVCRIPSNYLHAKHRTFFYSGSSKMVSRWSVP